MTPLFVVLDANVLFPLYVREVLLRLASDGIFSPIWSQEILDEATRNLIHENLMTVEQAAKFEAILKDLYPEAMVEVPVELVEKMTNHPKDRHVLATAVVGKAEIIVTDNLKDFQDRDLLTWNVVAKSSGEFLTSLYDLYPDEIVQAVDTMSEKLKDLTSARKPPLGLEALLCLLERVVPEFSNNIKFHSIKWQISKSVHNALSKFGRGRRNDESFLEGERYRISKKSGDIEIFSKVCDRQILLRQKQYIKSHLNQNDVDVFQEFQNALDKVLFEDSIRRMK